MKVNILYYNKIVAMSIIEKFIINNNISIKYVKLFSRGTIKDIILVNFHKRFHFIGFCHVFISPKKFHSSMDINKRRQKKCFHLRNFFETSRFEDIVFSQIDHTLQLKKINTIIFINSSQFPKWGIISKCFLKPCHNRIKNIYYIKNT